MKLADWVALALAVGGATFLAQQHPREAKAVMDLMLKRRVPEYVQATSPIGF